MAAPYSSTTRRSPRLLRADESESTCVPPSSGANSSSVSDTAPTKMYSPYVLIDPVSALASRVLDPYSDCVSPYGPSSSITPRSSTLDVSSPRCSAGSMIYRL